MNPLDSRPSLGTCNAAAGLGLAASNWQRAPRPPVRMASAPLLSPSAPHHTLAPMALHQPGARLAGAAAAPARSPLAAAPAAARGQATEAARSAQPASEPDAAPALRVSVRGPGPQGGGARPSRPAGAESAPRPAAPATTWLAAEPPAPWSARPAQRSDASAARTAPARAPRARTGSREVVFEFIGQGALSVLSSITGRCYRFEQPGAQLTVDARDVGQLARVSLLRCVPLAA